MRHFFTSDTHYGHLNVLAHQDNRRNLFGDDIAAHDEHLIEMHNSVVEKNDVVYHLGDFAWKPSDLQRVLPRLNGNLILVPGNHDRTSCRREFPTVVQPLHEVRIGRQRIVLCHYPLRTWNQSHRLSWHLHGHCHGNLSDDEPGLRLDVGVDSTEDLRPLSFHEVRDRMAWHEFKQVDHHAPAAPDSQLHR